MTMQFARLDIAARQARPRAGSSLVQAGLGAERSGEETYPLLAEGHGRQRLLRFGLTHDDIALLRG